MFAKLDDVEKRYEDIGRQLQDPGVTSDQNKYRTLMKDYSGLQEIVSTYRRYKTVLSEFNYSKEVIEKEKDAELRTMATEEMAVLGPEKIELEAKLKILLLPKDPNDDKNIILEIRAGAGGDEASLFAEELLRAYSHYADHLGWKTELMSSSPGNVGGYKEIIASITGEKVFSKLKYESGVHRVQRVPQTETMGRVHTSTVTVAVLPEVDEVDVKLNPADLRIDTYRAGGAGGQHVNKTDSAVRMTHIPTGIVVACQDERSQIKNRAKALKIMAARLQAAEEEKAVKDASDARLAQIGTGDRSERIRTYNYPQSRITDHRIGLTIHQLGDVMEGKFEVLIEPLITHFQAEALKLQIT